MTDFLKLKNEDSESSRTQQGKRMLADYATCTVDLKGVISKLFGTFNESLNKADRLLTQFPIGSRSRTLEASIIQSCFAECLFKNFPNNAKFGSYKRIVLNINGYLILFKKFDKHGLPMNIKTTNVRAILNQNQGSSLFAGTEYKYEPILYFGYQKSRIGGFENPQLVYIDEGHVIFRISENDQLSFGFTEGAKNGPSPTEVSPKLRNKDLKKAN